VASSRAETTASAESSVLIVGDDLARVDRFVSPLLRANYSVRRVLVAPTALKLIRRSPFDLIVVVLPFEAADMLLGRVRSEGSPCRRTGVLLVADAGLDAERAAVLSERANRVLPPSCTPEELQSAAELLLRAAPRVSVRASARLRFGAQGIESRTLAVENLSATGMLLSGSDPPPAACVFGFELAVASVDAPIRGQARVVRHTERRPGEHSAAATFLSFGGEGAKLLEKVIFQERAAAEARDWRGRSGATPSRAAGAVAIRDAEELALRREELAELEPFLEDLLRQGLGPRVRAADWYVAAAELGLESLAAFSVILETVHGGRTRRSEVSQQLADLNDVRRSLASFAGPKEDVPARIRILLGMRRSLERLLRALAITGAFGEAEGSGSRPRGLVAELALDIHRLLRARQLLGRLPGLIAELKRPRYVFARRAFRRRTEEIFHEYGSWAAELGLDGASRLRTRRGRKEVLAAARREIRRLDQRMAAVHQKVYTQRFHARASRDLAADFAETKLIPILVETLAAGAEFLVRAYSAFRHAVELTGSDPRLLDRVAGLAAAVAEAEKRLEGTRSRS